MKPKCTVLGLTGSIGMGKSTTAQMFRDLGVPVWDADQEVAELYTKNGGAVEALKALNPRFVTNNQVNRSEMKEAIKNDPIVLEHIESIIHPLVRESREAFLNKHSAVGLVVLDIPLLFETGAQDQVDVVLVVSASPDVQRERVLGRGTMTEDMFETILSKQLPDKIKRDRADYVIETKTHEGTRKEVISLIEKLGAKNA